MRQFLLVLALVGLVAQSAQAVEVNHSPEFRFDYTNNMEDDGSFVLRTGLLWTSTWKQDALMGRLQLVHTNEWSRLWQADWHKMNGESAYAHGHGHAYGDLMLAEASVRWDIMDNMYFAIGRAAKTLGSGKHVSADADSDFLFNSFDGLSLNYDTGFGWLKVFYASRTSRESTQPALGDVNNNVPNTPHAQHMQEARMGQMEAYGVNFDFKGEDMIPSMNLHAMQVRRGGEDNNQWRAAVNLMGEVEMSDMMKIGYDGTFVYVTGKRAEMINNTPQLKDVKSYMWDAMVSAEMSMFKVWGGMHQDTGDKGSTGDVNEGYDPFFYDRYNNAGFMNAVNWGNLTYYHFGASAMLPVIDTNIAAYYYMFKNTVAATETPSPDQEGSELDIVLSRQCSNNVSTSIRYSMLMPKEGSTMMRGDQAVAREKQQQIYWYTSITF